ncbi:DsrE family protein [Halorientalis brevis]|uniref:DsrE family protein n=1 Tax=Halorientalis brevis TaxID=1126241 RepID=A0ABD6C999_9EURY|nr:DsrE family protein [Halorientalis brevis]
MERRGFVSAAGTLGALLFGSETASATREQRGTQPQDARPSPPAKTVLHLSSGETAAYKGALMNAQNLLADETVPVTELVFLSNGPGVKLYTPPGRENDFADRINSLQERGVSFRVCQNSMAMLDLTEDQLIDGVEPVPSAVGEFARLQEVGYGYIKVP